MQSFCQKLKSSKTKFIFISGGVISGLGKGTTSASIAALLEGCGLKVFPIKVDMYLNIDAGTMNPLEHGETFVTADALECDQDIGTYERFLHRNLDRSNYFTAGQVYQSILDKERQLRFNGRCVEAFPHIPLEIIDFINRFPEDTDVVIVEYGGTVGEYQNEAFFEAARMMAACSPNQVCFVHIGYILQPPSLGEMKSKPMQMSIRMLNELGIFPDLLICRSENQIDRPRIEKIAIAAGVSEKEVFSCPNVDSIYKLPKILKDQGVLQPIFNKLHLNTNSCHIPPWENLSDKIDSLKRTIKIGIVAKYYTSGGSNLGDSYISVLEAVKHAAWEMNVKPEITWFDSETIEKDKKNLEKLSQVDVVIVPQGWGSRGVEGKVEAIKYVRENKIPYLGLCFGMQMATVEFGRNVVGLKDANSEEANPDSPHPVIHIMEEQKELIRKLQYGGTIRLGAWPCKIAKGTLIEEVYQKYGWLTDNSVVDERHRHRYEFNNAYREQYEAKGMHFTGLSPDGKLVEAVELDRSLHPYFIGTQFHPELISRPFTPHPLFLGLIEAGLAHKNA